MISKPFYPSVLQTWSSGIERDYIFLPPPFECQIAKYNLGEKVSPAAPVNRSGMWVHLNLKEVTWLLNHPEYLMCGHCVFVCLFMKSITTLMTNTALDYNMMSNNPKALQSFFLANVVAWQVKRLIHQPQMREFVVKSF